MVEIIASDARRVLDKADLGELRGKSVLVTGASGLIGVYFLACLKEFESLNPGRLRVAAVMQRAPEHPLTAFLDYEGVRVFRGDLADPGFCATLPSADVVIHSAGYAQPGRFMEDPLKTIRLNTAATLSLLERLSPGGKFLFVSSSEVYNGLPNPPYKESDIGTSNPTHPRACYIESKRCGEAICCSARRKGVDAKSARLSLAYGPGTRKNDLRAMNSFIQKAIAGRITLLDHGTAHRTYCYVSDAVEIMWNVLLRGREPVYNVGGFSRITIGDLARRIGEVMGVPVAFPETSRQLSGSPQDVSLDMDKVHGEFGPKEYVSLEDGLARTIEWQKLLYAA